MKRIVLALALVVWVPVAGFAIQTVASGAVDSEIAGKLLRVRRIYVESLGMDPASRQLQALLIDSLTATKRFIVTENRGKADAVIEGVGTEKSSQEMHSTKEGTLVGSGGGLAGISDSSASTETVTTAHLTVRLVSSDGDVIWSTEKESEGGKYKGASADVADEVVKQLMRDIDKLTAPIPASEPN